MRRLLVLALLLLAVPSSALASKGQEAMFQDDNELIYTTEAKRAERLNEVRALGVDRLRVTILWRAIAPDPTSRTVPAGLDATDSASYPPGTWTKYDQLVRQAGDRGLKVNFNITGPSPNWANQVPPRKDIADNYEPAPGRFAEFVAAVGKRYDGTYPDSAGGTLPRVDYWSIWNEPNHSGWLTPTWKKSGGVFFERSASLYRSLVDAAYAALAGTGHTTRTDTILIGETAPAGSDTSRNVKRFMTPLRFIRALYCLDGKLHRLTGRAAKRLGCGTSTKAFVQAHPVLFTATGFAHHPYELLFGPTHKPPNRNYATIGVLSRLTRTLDTAVRRYGSHKRFPIYLTEFGYQTNPPDTQAIPLRKQGPFLNHAEYIAARNPRVKALAQFLLVDGGEPVGLTFQSGLRFRNGKAKPAYNAYRLPIWTRPTRTGSRVWGNVRPAKAGGDYGIATLEFRKRGRKTWKRLKQVPNGPFSTTVRTGRGRLRLTYGRWHSRTVRVR